MLRKVKKYIQSNNLTDHNNKYLIAFSGGADSTALLLMMQELGYDVEAAHCNFHLRGKESDRDEEFCRNLCKQKKITLHIAHFDTKEYAALHKKGIEEAARILRYNYFAQLCRDIECQAVMVAHHQDDSVETILLNLLRGTGIQGLQGIKPIREIETANGKVKIIRPLLCISRQEITEWLKSKNQNFVTDSTNLETDAMRNKIRLQLLPVIDSINPKARQNILLTAKNIAQMPVEQQLFMRLSAIGFTGKQIEQIHNCIKQGRTGALFSSKTHNLVVKQDSYRVEKIKEPIKPMTLPEPGNYIIAYEEDEYEVRQPVKLKITVSDNIEISKEQFIATIDAEKIKWPLTVRPIQEGDRLRPFGMKGSKLVSDYLTDRKIDLLERKRQLTVVDSNGIIVWLIGHTTNDLCRITKHTAKVVRMEFISYA